MLTSCQSWKGLYVFSYLKSLLAVLSLNWNAMYIFNISYNSLLGEERWKLLNISTSILTLAV